MQALTELELSRLKIFCKGKVRTVYDLGENLLIVTSDRISAFDRVLPSGIPDKGKILTGLSGFWFRRLGRVYRHHMITDRVEEFPTGLADFLEILRDRSMLVRKARRIEVECIVRGYLAGSAWEEYSERGTVAGIEMPAGLAMDARMDPPLFTPSTKSEKGHDRPMTVEEMGHLVGVEATARTREVSLGIYGRASRFAEERGLVLVDAKFEFGYVDGEVVLIDEILTPDSSRYLMRESPGGALVSVDKQFIRDYLKQSGWDMRSPPPALPAGIISECRRRYILLYEKLTGRVPEWLR